MANLIARPESAQKTGTERFQTSDKKTQPAMPGKARAGNHLRRHCLLIVCLFIVIMTASGCLDLNQWRDSVHSGIDRFSEGWSSLSDQVSSLASSMESDTPAGDEQTTEQPGQDLPDDALAGHLQALIQAGIEDFSAEIILDKALEGYQISERQSDAVVKLVYDVYEKVYRQNPQFFWLDGSAKLNYTFQKGLRTRLSAMTLKLGYLDEYKHSSAAELQARQDELFTAARQIAAKAEKKTQAWQQLQVIHDTLVRRIVYDQTLNQAHNNAASALLDQISLCQGYAQAFQLIASELGFRVELINGQASEIDHAWNLVWIAGQPYHLDVTHDDPVPDGGSTDKPDHVNFLRSDTVMRETHDWKASDYPVCAIDGAHYYREQDLLVSSLDEYKQKFRAFVNDSDLGDQTVDQLELLYTGSDLPSRKSVEKIVVSILTDQAGVRALSYRLDVSKQVIIVELMPAR